MKRRASMLPLGAATTAWPFSAGAQQRSIPEAGHVEGQNVAVEYRWADDQYDRAPAMAADLVDRKVDVITTIGAHLTVAMSPMSLAS